MRAVVYEGPRKVSVQDVPDARIERSTDVLVRITTTNICGSDLHMYEGRTDFEPGRWFGHENMGEVIEVGNGIDKDAGRRPRRPALQRLLRALQEL
jgi:glutathione-independent formaldehyde dehydrogenase